MTIHITTEEDRGVCLIAQAREEGRKQGIEEARQVALKEAECCANVARLLPPEKIEHTIWQTNKCTAVLIAKNIGELVNHGSPLQDSLTRTDNKETTL